VILPVAADGVTAAVRISGCPSTAGFEELLSVTLVGAAERIAGINRSNENRSPGNGAPLCID
jgi:hypothetical protein